MSRATSFHFTKRGWWSRARALYRIFFPSTLHHHEIGASVLENASSHVVTQRTVLLAGTGCPTEPNQLIGASFSRNSSGLDTAHPSVLDQLEFLTALSADRATPGRPASRCA